MSEAIRHMRMVNNGIQKVVASKDNPEELLILAREMKVSYETALQVADLGRLPVINFAAGGVATPADAAHMMRMKCDGVFVGSGIYKSQDPENRANAIVYAVTNWDNPEKFWKPKKWLMKNFQCQKGIAGMAADDKIQQEI